MTRFILCLAFMAMACNPSSTPADCRHVQVVQQLQAAVQYQPVYTPYLYAVGSNLQTQASEERIANLVIQKLQAQQLKAPRKYGEPLTKQQCLDLASEYEGTAAAFPDDEPPAVPAPQTLPLTAEVDRWANTKQVCAGCHTTGADAMAHVNMADFSALTCEQKLSAIRNMVEGKMPPPKSGKVLSAEQLGQIIGEFAGADNVTQP